MFRSVLVSIFVLVSHAAQVSSQDTAGVVERTVWVTLSDEVHLATDLYLPRADEKFPVLLIRTPYGKAGPREQARYFAANGYACVVQDCRGSGASKGDFYAYVNEGKDGYETQEWIGKQSWCNGTIGTLGASYLGGTQWLTAPYGSRHLKTMAPMATFSSFYGNLYFGGAFRLDMAGRWAAGRESPSPEVQRKADYLKAFLHTPFVEMDQVLGWQVRMLRDWTANDSYGPYWQALDVEYSFEQLDIPVLHVVGFYDFFLPETVKSYQLMARFAMTEKARRQQKLILGPWDHGTIGQRKVGEVDFGPNAVVDLNALHKRWFNRHLKEVDNGIDREPPIRYFVMGLNDWRESFRWPPQTTRPIDYYFSSGGNANTAQGDGLLSTEPPSKEGSDSFVSDPNAPIPSKGGRDVEPTYKGTFAPHDQRGIEANANVLVYTSTPLEHDMEVAGPLTATLSIETDAVDTDIVVKLVDVHPDGFAQDLVTGILRGRFRKSRSTPELLTPGKVHEWKVDMTHVSNRFLAGHRIRVDVSGSCFPTYDRNPNTGEGPRSKTSRVARQRLHHSPLYLSRVTLPVSTSVTTTKSTRK